MILEGVKRERVSIEVDHHVVLDSLRRKVIGHEKIIHGKWCSHELVDYHKGEYGYVPYKDATEDEIEIYECFEKIECYMKGTEIEKALKGR